MLNNLTQLNQWINIDDRTISHENVRYLQTSSYTAISLTGPHWDSKD